MEDLDGSGFSLRIPAMLISGADANLLMQALNKGDQIKLQANLEIAHASATSVEVSLWYGSLLDLPDKLIEELYEY